MERRHPLASPLTEEVKPSPPGLKGQHRPPLPSTIGSQVEKRPDHLSGATPTPSCSWALSHPCPDSPTVITASCLALRLGPVGGGEGSRHPSGQGLLWRKGGLEVKATQPPGISESGSQGRAPPSPQGGQSTNIYQTLA